MKITILGAGNAGYAHACKLKENGHIVHLVKTSTTLHEDSFRVVKDLGGIWVQNEATGGGRAFHKLDMITRRPEEAIPSSDVVMVLTQSLQHEQIAQRIGHLLEDRQLVLIIPGNMGSLFFRRHAKSRDVIFAEGESTPYDARITRDGEVTILFKNVRNALAFLPSKRKDEGMRIAGELFDTYKHTRKHIIESALHNPNMVVHTIGTIMSASRIEYAKGEFWMYREAFTPSIWNLVNELDKEKNDVLETFDCDRLSYLDACKFRNEADLSVNSLEVFKGYARHGGPKGPSNLETRFLYEDVPVGLCFLSSLAKKHGIDTPLCDSLIKVAGFLLNRNFWEEARTVEKLSIDKLMRSELLDFLA